MSVLVIDVGTSGVRSAVVDGDGRLHDMEYRANPPSSPAAGLVEFDGAALAATVTDVAGRTIDRHRSPIDALGITTQRASAVAWSRSNGTVLAAGIGWQDLRTVGQCLSLRASHGLVLAPNQSATKMMWLLDSLVANGVDIDDVCLGTVDSWLVWVLSRGSAHVTDQTNAAVTGLTTPDGLRWDDKVLDILGIDIARLPRIVPTIGAVAEATALGAPVPITAIVGDQQASLVGQGCIDPGDTKITFGTGGMLDVFAGATPPSRASRSNGGTFPIVAYGDTTTVHYGAEAVMLAAGTNVEWLQHDLGIISSPDESETLAANCTDSGGVVYVPALLGLGTPHWDYGARGALFGLTRGSNASHVVRAVLEGVAHRAVDLIDAARLDTGLTIDEVRVDGGMSRNRTFIGCLADAASIPVRVSEITEATTLGAAFLAGVGHGTWPTLAHATGTLSPAYVAEPAGAPNISRDRWAEAVSRSRTWIPDLSALDF